MPYHVAFEFMRCRPEIIFETVERYSKLKQEAEKLLHACSEMLRVKMNDPEYLELQKYINQWLSTNKKKNLLVDNVTDDPILERILQLYENKVGPDFRLHSMNIQECTPSLLQGCILVIFFN